MHPVKSLPSPTSQLRTNLHFETRLPADRHGPAEARRQLNGWLTATIGDPLADRVRLAASEVVSNAVRYGRVAPTGDLELVVDLSDRAVRVAVEQAGDAEAAAIVPPEDRGERGGFGLAIVQDVTDRWGVEPPGRVWFEVDRNP